MSKKTRARSLSGFLLLFCVDVWSGCASQGGAPPPPDQGAGPLPDLAAADQDLATPDAASPPDLRMEQSVLWLKQLPSSANVDSVRQIAVDKSGNVFVACQFSARTDFGDGPRDTKGDHDIALVKLTDKGDLVWVRQFGSPETDMSLAMATDDGGNVVVAGSFSGSIDLGSGPLTSHGNNDYYLAKYAGDGRLLWAKAIGSSDFDSYAASLAIDGGGQIYFTGSFGLGTKSSTIDLGGGPLTTSGYADGFLVKYDPSGTHVFSKRVGGPWHDALLAVAVDKGGDILLGGQMSGTVDLGGGPVNPGTETTTWGAIVRLTSSGAYKWATGYYSGGARVADLAIDDTGAIAVSGSFARMMQTRTTSLSSLDARTHGFLLQLDAAGSEKWARATMAGGDADTTLSLVVDSNRIYLGGMFEGTATFGTGTHTAAGGSDAYLGAYSLDGVPQWIRTFGSTDSDELHAIRRGADALYAGGMFSATADFGGTKLTAKAATDGFVAKLPLMPPATP